MLQRLGVGWGVNQVQSSPAAPGVWEYTENWVRELEN